MSGPSATAHAPRSAEELSREYDQRFAAYVKARAALTLGASGIGTAIGLGVGAVGGIALLIWSFTWFTAGGELGLLLWIVLAAAVGIPAVIGIAALLSAALALIFPLVAVLFSPPPPPKPAGYVPPPPPEPPAPVATPVPPGAAPPPGGMSAPPLVSVEPAAKAPSGPQHHASTVIDLPPFALLFGEISIEVERVLWPHFSIFGAPLVRLGAPVASTQFAVNPIDLGIVNHVGLNAGARFFPVSEAPSGFFIAPQGHAIVSEGDFPWTNGRHVGAGLELGYSTLFTDHVYGSVGAGAAADYELGSAQWNVIPLLRANLGWAW